MTAFEPPDERFADRVRESFAKQAIMRTFEARLTDVLPGRVEITMPFRDDLTQQHGFLHAGAIATIVDSACGYAAYSLMPADAAVLSIEFKVNMLAPAKGERLIARASVIRAGRQIIVCSGDAFMLSGGGEKHVASMTGTMMTVRGRDGLKG